MFEDQPLQTMSSKELVERLGRLTGKKVGIEVIEGVLILKIEKKMVVLPMSSHTWGSLKTALYNQKNNLI